jgi:hypothetical protein
LSRRRSKQARRKYFWAQSYRRNGQAERKLHWGNRPALRSSVGPKIDRGNRDKKKIYFTSLNYSESLVFLPELQNWVNHLPQLLKPFILPLWPGYSWFSKAVLSFSFLFISSKYLKNFSKSHKNHKIKN